jgi:hypothetical protein
MEFPDPALRRPIVERYARLLARLDREIGVRPLVLPTGEFFPDRFSGDEASAGALVDRMMDHAGLSDVPLATRVVVEQEPEPLHGGCSSGCQVPAAVAASVPRLVDDGEQWTLGIPAYELAHSVVLTTMIARALGHVFLVETLAAGARIEPPVDVTADYAAVALGFGPLLLEGAYIYSKGCGGPQVASVTAASLGELALVTSLFIERGGHSARRALGALGTTQRAVLSEAHSWAKSNAALVKALRERPSSVAEGAVRLDDQKPWLFRILKKGEDDDMPRDLEAVRGAALPAPKAVDPERDELRSLVDEALRSARADAE